MPENFFDLAVQNGINMVQNEPMSAHTTFRIGGNAKYFAEVENEQQLIDLLKLCREYKVPVTILGNGSNMLVPDEGIDGCVIKLSGSFGQIELNGDRIICGTAVPLSKLCIFAAENNLSGLEFAYGIPGNTGGAAFMNAGAYGGQMSDVLVACHHITLDGEKGSIPADELELGYRHSIYADNGYIITAIEVQLNKGDKQKIYDQMNELMQRRRDKQPLEYPSAGSIFKRPEGYFAGTLIEQSGLKGYTIGGAQVSEKHAGFIINIGNATCNDVLNLIEHIQKTVLDRFGVQLECEVRQVRPTAI